MLSRMRIQWTRPETNADDETHHEWERLLANASSPQERDEINDVFSRSVAA